MKQFLIAMVLLLSALSFSQNDTLFEQANQLYSDANYTEALQKYKAIMDSGEQSAALYFNMANAHYKLNHIAPSIYYYEKASLLNPNDKDIKNNMAFAKNMTLDAIDTVPEVGLAKLMNSWTKTFYYEVWAKISVAFAILFVILFISYFFVSSTGKKRFAFVSSILCLLLVFASFGLAYHGHDLVANNQPAIVFAKEAQIKSEPNLRSTEAFKLHEGTKVQVLDSVDNWKKIKLADGKTGWVMNEDIKLVKTF
ncbi:SH3 domain-containing protein [Subsaximicrobium wynnwilliamsii]|uniref:SH3 domain-containing protein n=1 Tax=Subsaximicrobium wynnwilliamsii TaxID=291179 RepID=A0A5C6ZGN7_9FLAO|nr:SH3 domain-containing protein [Subsaximicrobium wynnwilliamsii]TXD82721.1 SH3 domain-containing protein [Subsaximicrobium wynnwilliamsii]TXD88456.1 SH3 domain-containing protein [Subsaximicrobium wynnwilliamsii]TXE02383.1 SH3 domain-containing protein [Subsaximicrobium wynnwilliamsii]